MSGQDKVKQLRDLKERAKGFCQLAETCPYISRAECTKCIQYYITYFPRR